MEETKASAFSGLPLILCAPAEACAAELGQSEVWRLLQLSATYLGYPAVCDGSVSDTGRAKVVRAFEQSPSSFLSAFAVCWAHRRLEQWRFDRSSQRFADVLEKVLKEAFWSGEKPRVG